jgi:hypothetical protein
MMFRLPPPPRFTLPPPPMISADIFDTKLLFRLTCSSIRQQQHRQFTNSRLIVISCITFLITILLFTLSFIIIQSYRKRKTLFYDYESKPSTTVVIKSNNLPMTSSRSYETISSQQTGVYVESIDTSATTYSTDPSSIVCIHCHQEHDYSTTSPPPYYHTLDILPT